MLIAHFPLCGEVTQNSGSCVWNLSNTPPVSDVYGILSGGRAASFDSLNDTKICITKQKLYRESTDPISIFCWVYMKSNDSTGANLNGLVSNHDHSVPSGFGLNLRNDGSNFYVSVSTPDGTLNGTSSDRTYSTIRSQGSFTSGSWHNVGFTYDGANIKLYLDGVLQNIYLTDTSLQASSVSFTTTRDSNNPIGIGCWSTSFNGYGSKCYIQDVRVYNHCLSNLEISNISKCLVLHYNFENLYKPVEYLQSSGTQWIDSGVSISKKTNIKAKILWNTLSGSYPMIYGAWPVFSLSPCAAKTCISSGGISANPWTSGPTLSTNTIYTIIHTPEMFVINDVVYNIGNGNNTASTRRILLFASSDSSTGDGGNLPYNWSTYSKARIYYFKIYGGSDGKQLLRDYIPVIRTLDGKPGLYDRVSGTFKTNQGTGEFTFRDEIEPCYSLNAAISNNTIRFKYGDSTYSELPSGLQNGITTGFVYNSSTGACFDSEHFRITINWKCDSTYFNSILYPIDYYGDGDAIKTYSNSSHSNLYLTATTRNTSLTISDKANAFMNFFYPYLVNERGTGEGADSIREYYLNQIATWSSSQPVMNSPSTYNGTTYGKDGRLYQLTISEQSHAERAMQIAKSYNQLSSGPVFFQEVKATIDYMTNGGVGIGGLRFTKNNSYANTNSFVVTTMYHDKYSVSSTDIGSYNEWGHRGIISKDSYETAFISATVPQTTSYIMIGLAPEYTGANASDYYNYTHGYYIYPSDTGVWQLYENSSSSTSGYSGTYNAGDRFRVTYDGKYMKYYVNDTLVKETAVQIAQPLHASITSYNDGAVNDVSYGSLDLIRDISGNNLNAEAHNVEISNDNSSVGMHALSFNGTNSYVRCPYSIIAPQNTKSFAISVWAKTSSTGNQCLFCDRSSTGNGPALFLLSGTYVRFDTGEQTSYNFNYGDGLWHHYFAMYYNGYKYLYIDGMLQGSKIQATDGSCGVALTFGGSYPNMSNSYPNGNWFSGNIADWRLYRPISGIFVTDEKINDFVSDLYKTRFFIDNKYNVYSDGNTTSSEFNLKKNGVLAIDEISAGIGNNTIKLIKNENYTVLEYLESDGSVYINTGYFHNTQSTKYECEFTVTSLPQTYNTIFGSRITHNGDEAYYIGIMNKSSTVYNKMYGCIGGTKRDPLSESLSGTAYISTNSNNNNYTHNNRYHLKTDPVIGMTLNHRYTYDINSRVSTVYRSPDYIFAGNFNNSVSEFFTGRIYYFKIYENDTLVKYFIPVKRKSDNMLGMFEAVSGTFIAGSGSGSFTAGPEIKYLNVLGCNNYYSTSGALILNPSRIDARYEILDYINSNGAQRINTGVYTYTSYMYYYEQDIQFSSTGSRQLMGGDGNTGTYWGINESGYFEMEGATTILGTDKIHNVVYHPGSTLWIDGVSVKTSSINNTGTVYNLFALSSAAYHCTCRLYHFRIFKLDSDNNKIILSDMYPARDIVTGSIGLYDRIRDQFLKSAQSGTPIRTFGAGPVIGYI